MAQKKPKRENLERTERTQERTKPLFPPAFQALSKYYWRELLHLSSAVDQKAQRGVSDDYKKYCNEILQQYPEYITKDQMYRICHISKKTCLFLLESGLVPNIDSGKKTRRFKIKTVDVIQYLKDRDDYPELFKAPDGFYKGKGGDKKAPSL